jgi:integrase
MTGTRKDNGESWVGTEKNARGYYEASVWMGVKGNGRPDRRHVQRKSQKAVKERVKELERKRDLGQSVKAGKAPTVQQMLERHLTVVLPQRGVSPTTIRGYRSQCRTDIFPRWGAQRIDRLQAEDIEEGLADMLAEGKSAATVVKARAILSAALADQVKRERIARNPCAIIRPTKIPDRKMASLSEDEAMRVLDAAAKHVNAPRWSLAILRGLRQGEVLGPRWDDLDLNAGRLLIHRQLQRLTWSHGCADQDRAQYADMNDEKKRKARLAIEHACAAPHCKVKPCKKVKGKCRLHTRECPPPCPADCTDHARLCPHRKGGGLVFREIKENRQKTVRLTAPLIAELKGHRDAQFLQKETTGELWDDHGLIFCRWNGKPVDPRRDYGEWQQILKEAGLPRHRLHALRHSAASIALDGGADIAVVQEMLGHSDIRMTRRYAHPSDARHDEMGRQMDRLLGGGK